MSLFDKIFGKKTIITPTFIKDFSKENQHLQALNDFYSQVVCERCKKPNTCPLNGINHLALSGLSFYNGLYE